MAAGPDETADQRLDRYRDRYRSLQAQVTELGFISSGSVVRRHTFCGTAGRRCQTDPLRPHGSQRAAERILGDRDLG